MCVCVFCARRRARGLCAQGGRRKTASVCCLGQLIYGPFAVLAFFFASSFVPSNDDDGDSAAPRTSGGGGGGGGARDDDGGRSCDDAGGGGDGGGGVRARFARTTRREFVPAFVSGLAYWPAVDLLSFAFVPWAWMPLASNAAAYVWTVGLALRASALPPIPAVV